ncbi:hypothetical protein ACFOW8_26240 [Nocardia rhizosphaerae]|uniref:Uncharacterized protein n=1 Tax=Nocardia rhizosphaerae TaxID=1691571 RepID=A0ABV8LC05_9NOCA
MASAPAPYPIVTVTRNPTVDLALEVDRLRPEGKSRARVSSVRGGGVDVARCVHRLGRYRAGRAHGRPAPG